MNKNKCIKCGKEKPLNCFTLRTDTNTYRNDCKECKSKYDKERRKRLIKIIKKMKRKYYQKNKEYIKQKSNKYYKNNKERVLKKEIKYYIKNREKKIEYTKRYAILNKEKVRFWHLKCGRARRSYKLNRNHENYHHWIKKMLSREWFACYWCHNRFGINKFTIDHIIPLSRGGEDIRANVVESCHSCNCSKGKKLVDEWFKYLKYKERVLNEN